MVALNDQQLRLCSHCFSAKPIDQFRHRTPDGSRRHSQCKDCHNKSERARLKEKRRTGRKRRLAARLGELSRARSGREVERLCRVMLLSFGGMRGFQKAFADHYQWAQDNRGYPLIRCLLAYMRVVSHHDEMRLKEQRMAEAEPGYDSIQYWSDEELECAYQKSVVESIEQKPELAIEAARKLGWTVIPPEGQFPEE